MKIVQVPHPVLYQPVGPVSLKKIEAGESTTSGTFLIDKRTRKIIAEMIDAMKAARNPEGVGLAANQLGLSMAIFVMMPRKNADVIVCINPKIISTEQKLDNESNQDSQKATNSPAAHHHQKRRNGNERGMEGCLSIPNIWGEVDRIDRVRLAYVDGNGVTVDRWFEGFEAIVVQHEMDHLNGILFTQRAVEQGHELVKEVGNGEFEHYRI